MKRLLLALAFILVVAGGAYAQESEISGGGGGSSSVGPGTAGAIPKFASTTTLGDSKLVTSGTNGGTLTLYDDTAVTGVSQLWVRSGAGQSSTPQLILGSNMASCGASLLGLDGANGLEIWTQDKGQHSNVYVGRLLPFSGQWVISGEENAITLGSGVPIQWSSTTAYNGAVDIAISRASAGVLKVTDGSSGYGQINPATVGFGGQAFLTSEAADTVAQRNGTNGQTFNLYGTYTDGSNYSRLAIKDNTSFGSFDFLVQSAGTGPGRHIQISPTSNANVYIGNGNQWVISSGTPPTITNGDNLATIGSSSGAMKAVYTTSIQGWQTKTLTESAATGFVDIALAQNTVIGGFVEYVVRTTNGTDYSTESGQVFFTGASKTSGTIDDADVGLVGTPIQSTTAANAWTNTFTVTKGTNKLTLNCNSVSSLSGTDTITLFYRVHLNGAQTETITGL